MPSILISLLLLLPSQRTQTLSRKAAEECTVQGVVVKTESGEPLKKAVVTLHEDGANNQGSSAATDATGRFEIKAGPGRYHMWAWRNGYVQQYYGERTPGGAGTTLSLGAGQKVSDIMFRLIPAAAITGHVYDEDGEPVARAQVSALGYSYSYPEGQRELADHGYVQTNDLGEFRIYGLAPGQYYVRASYNAERYGLNPAPGGYLPIFYPGTADVGTAAPIVLRSGGEFSGVEISLQAVHTVTVRGRVFNAVGGQPAAHASIFLVKRESDLLAHTFTHPAYSYVQDPQGAFELRNVTPGTYYLYANLQEEGKNYSARMPLEVTNTDIEGVTLNVTRGLDIKGQLRVEGAALSSLGSLGVNLQPKNEVISFGMGGHDYLKPDGSFLLGGVHDGDYDLYVFTLPEDYFLKSARLDGNEVLASGLTIDAHEAPKLLEVVVSANGARLEGVVEKDNHPFSGATVVLVPDPPHRNDRRLFRETTTDQSGHYLLRGIAPGDYKLFAWENPERGAYRSADFLQPFEDRGRSVNVREGASLSAQLDLIPAKDSGP